MLFAFIITILSEFDPENKPECLTVNKCPSNIDTIITSLTPEQFCGCQYPNSIIKIDDSIEVIPKYSFYGANIKQIILHSNVRSIEEGAFGESEVKINLSEASNLRTIGDGAFFHSKIKDIQLVQTFESIGSYAFANMTQIDSITIKAKFIKSNAFLGCYNMKPELIEIIGSGSISKILFVTVTN